MTNNITKIHKYFNIVINIGLLIIAYYFIYIKLFDSNIFKEGITIISQQINLSEVILYLLIIVLVLMPLNLTLESLKWRYLMRRNEKLSLRKAITGVLAGITTSLITPNRVGDFIGKAFLLKKADRGSAILISLIGSISQLLVTFLVGSLSISVLAISFPEEFNNFSHMHVYVVVFLTIALNIFLLLLYFKVPFVSGNFKRFIPSRWSTIHKYRETISKFTANELLEVLMLSFLRFIVFNFQLFILFRLFKIDLTIFESYIISSCIFFILGFIPSNALVELGIRGSVTIIIFGLFYKGDFYYSDYYKFASAIAINLLWMINILIPSLLGSFFVMRLRFFRKSFYPSLLIAR